MCIYMYIHMCIYICIFICVLYVYVYVYIGAIDLWSISVKCHDLSSCGMRIPGKDNSEGSL